MKSTNIGIMVCIPRAGETRALGGIIAWAGTAEKQRRLNLNSFIHTWHVHVHIGLL
jgi:hypothetical protein